MFHSTKYPSFQSPVPPSSPFSNEGRVSAKMPAMITTSAIVIAAATIALLKPDLSDCIFFKLFLHPHSMKLLS
jgi:hypothetical protein